LVFIFHPRRISMTDRSLAQLLSSRENLQQVLDNLKVGIIAHDLSRRIFFFNAEAERVTGYGRDEVLGKDCHVALGAPFCGDFCSFCDGQAPAPLDDKAYAVDFAAKSGEIKRIEMSVTMMRNQAGAAVGVLVSFQDTTELTRLKLRSGVDSGFAGIIGRDSQMLKVFQQIRDVAEYDFPVHIYGETGTGKELVANAVHHESRRKGAPFVPINCGALPEGLIESELFGHVKGAFSGAIRDKKGRFELADGGSVFLDEVAELSKLLQVKLLRFLQEGTFEKVGAERTVSVNVRVISATNKDLKKEIQKNHFREDLYYRLNVIPIHIPPIRERKTDIPLLIDHFLLQARKDGLKKQLTFSEEAIAQMLDYGWPGNVRELQNAVQFAIVRSSGPIIGVDDLPLELRSLTCYPAQRGPVKKLEAGAVQEALIRTGGNKARAAKQLKVGRATLYRFLADHPELRFEGQEKTQH
jgi:PAS domain S-box-containing protein